MNHEMRDRLRLGVEHLVEVNSKHWADSLNCKYDGGWIYVLHTTHHSFSTTVCEDVIAKGLQKREHLPIASIISGRKGELMDLTSRVDASFGAEYRVQPSYYDYHNEDIETLACKMASDTYGDPEGLIALTYRDIRFGDVLYDDLLRSGNHRKRGEAYSCFDISRERYQSTVKKALATIDQAYEIFEQRKPSYLITTEFLYIKALYAHVASLLGAKILVASTQYPDMIVQVSPEELPFSELRVADITRMQMEKCVRGYQEIDNNTGDLFLASSVKEDLPQFSEGQVGEKTVFILPHAMSDVPREACRNNIYFDYVQWFSDTIRIIKEIPGVNWVVKDHPWADYYGQSDYVKRVFDENKTENMYWIDKEYGGINIKDYADCVITCAGDAGIEYWAYGIPTISTAESHYSGLGISYQMRSIAEYEHTLKNIKILSKPSAESVKLAQKYLYAMKNWYKKDGSLSELIYNTSRAEGNVWILTGGHFGAGNPEADNQQGEVILGFCKAFVTLLQQGSVKESNIYRLTNILNL